MHVAAFSRDHYRRCSLSSRTNGTRAHTQTHARKHRCRRAEISAILRHPFLDVLTTRNRQNADAGARARWRNANGVSRPRAAV